MTSDNPAEFDPQDIDSVTEDRTPTVIPTFVTREPDFDRCASCGEEVSLNETAWVWRGRIFCDKARCKPTRRMGISGIF